MLYSFLSSFLVACATTSPPVPLTVDLVSTRLEPPVTSGGFLKGRIGGSLSSHKNVAIVKDMADYQPLSTGTGLDEPDSSGSFRSHEVNYMGGLGLLPNIDLTYNTSNNTVGLKYGYLQDTEQGYFGTISLDVSKKSSSIQGSKTYSYQNGVGSNTTTDKIEVSSSGELYSQGFTVTFGKGVHAISRDSKNITEIVYGSFTQTNINMKAEFTHITNGDVSNQKKYNLDDAGAHSVLSIGYYVQKDFYGFILESGLSRLTWPRASYSTNEIKGVSGVSGFLKW